MTKKNAETNSSSRSPDELKNRIVKVFIIILFILSPVWLLYGTALIAGAVQKPVNVCSESIRFYSFVYTDTGKIYSPAAFDSQYSRISSYYCIAENENKYVIVHFSSEEWESMALEETPGVYEPGQLYEFSGMKRFSGAQSDIPSALKAIIIDYYNEHIGTGLADSNFNDVFSSRIIESNDKSQLKDGCTNLVFISLALLIGYLYLSKNKKKKTQE